MARTRFSLWFAISCSLSAFACETQTEYQSICPSGTEAVAGNCVHVSRISVNTLGYTPGAIKRATLAGPTSEFIVRRVSDGEVALRGVPKGPLVDTTTIQDQLYIADFSELQEPGVYSVEAAGLVGVQPSRPFKIAEGVFDGALNAAVLGMTGLRCGTAVDFKFEGEHYQHGACHLSDVRMEKSDTPDAPPRDGTGGWHDAGDYGRYTVNSALAVGNMLKAWEHFPEKLVGRPFDLPERDNGIPDFLDEVKWQLDWMLKMQNPDGSVAHKLTTESFAQLTVSPDADVAPLYLSKYGTPATADLVAVMASAARVYAPYDAAFAARCQAAATLSWNFLLAHPENVTPDLSAFAEAQYVANNDSDLDDRLWAAAEYWETTGDVEALAIAQERLQGADIRPAWDWPDLTNFGIFTYLFSKRADAAQRDGALVEKFYGRVIAIADLHARTAEEHPYGLGLKMEPYWGMNGIYARSAMTLGLAYLIGPEESRPRYLNAVAAQVDHLLGRNYYGRSFVTGMGGDPPLNPHHRPSMSDRSPAPWPGLLIGGSCNSCEHGSMKSGFATLWKDDTAACSSEVAINWNAPLIYALTMLVR